VGLWLQNLPALAEWQAGHDSGRPDFHRLQHFGAEASRIQYFVFDVLIWNGRDLTVVLPRLVGIWYDWNIDGRRITKPIGTRDWQRAQQLAREMEAEGRVLDPNGKTVTVERACDDFLADAKARGSREPSLYKYKLLLARLKTFAADKGLTFISHFDVDTTAKFRESWTNKGTSARKKLESLRTFFTFCHDRNWVESNPAKKLKMGKNEEPPVEPFTKDQVARILAAIADYPDKQNAVRLRALILLLRYSGLRIGDAVTLDRSRIESGRLFLRTAKTGTRVFVPLPKASLDALDACPHERTPFWTGESKRKSVIGNWQRAMKKLFKLAKVPDGHPHRFRHYSACGIVVTRSPSSCYSPVCRWSGFPFCSAIRARGLRRSTTQPRCERARSN
jgi:integrase/recombinase XerD